MKKTKDIKPKQKQEWHSKAGAGEWGTDTARNNYQKDTPGQPTGKVMPWSVYIKDKK
jgi:hypothetical protein